VLDAGAGTGLGSDALVAAGARPVALDAALAMVRWRSRDRPPAVVAEVGAVPLCTGCVDDVLAAFVLNHLTRPVEALCELARTVRPGGALLASTFSAAWRSPVRDRIDEVAVAHGWSIPGWYRQVREEISPLLGSAPAMAGAARSAGLSAVAVAEGPVDVGVDRPEQLVRYRLGQAQFAEHLRTLGADGVDRLRRAAVDAVAPVMEPYRPVVVHLVARVP
jgi:SAM-dependent methyltransferase